MSDIVKIAPSKEQIENVKKMVVKNLTDDEISEIISIKKIEKGEKTLENFSHLIKFGGEIPRPGRIKWEELKDSSYVKYIKESEYDDLTDGLLDDVFFDKELKTEHIEDMREEGEEEELAFFKEVENEVNQLISKGLVIDRNLVWDIKSILTMEKQKYYLKREGNDIGFLKELYSYIPEKKMKRIQKRWKKRWE